MACDTIPFRAVDVCFVDQIPGEYITRGWFIMGIHMSPAFPPLLKMASPQELADVVAEASSL